MDDEKKYRKNDGKSAEKLRELGFVPLPRLWVTEPEMREILKIAKKNEDVVNAIRHGEINSQSDLAWWRHNEKFGK